MGMFDWYEPAGDLRCPIDGSLLRVWQGKGGPRLLFRWNEGVKHPVAHEVDEEIRYSPDELQKITLPPSFRICCFDCPQHGPILAHCTTQDNIWVSTQV